MPGLQQPVPLAQAALEEKLRTRIVDGESATQVLAETTRNLQMLSRIADTATGETRTKILEKCTTIYGALQNRKSWSSP